MKEPLLAKILRYCAYATAFMPLIIFSNYISPFHFGKVIVFRSLVEMMAALYLVLVWQDRAYAPKKTRLFWAFLAFAGAFTVATAASINPYMSFWGTLERMGGLFTFWHYFIYFVILTSVLRTHEQWAKYLHLTIFASILSALYGFGQRTNISFFIGSGNRERIFGTIGNAALFAGYEIVNFFLALTLLMRPGNVTGKKLLFASAVALDGLAIVMTVVRGSLLGLGTGLMVFLTLYYLHTSSRKAKLMLLTVVTAAAVFLLIIITPLKDASFFKESRFLSRLTDTSLNNYTAKTRFWAWQAGIQGWSQNAKTVLLGWGPENFNVPFSEHFNPQFFRGPGSETFFDRAHNMFVEVLVTMGLLGLVAYVGLFAMFFKEASAVSKNKPDERIYTIGLISLGIAYIIHNCFIFDTSANFLVFFSVFGFLSFLSLPHREDEKRRPEPYRSVTRSPAMTTAAALLIVLALIFVYYFNIRAANANYATTRGIVLNWNNDFKGALAKYTEALAYDGAGKYEIRNRFAQDVLEYSTRSKSDPLVVDALKQAIGEVQKNADENSMDYLPLLYLARLNVVLGSSDPVSPYNDKALEYTQAALKISPTFVRTYYEIAQVYLNKKDFPKAIEAFKKAAELNPDVAVSYWYWGMTEFERGDTQTALQLIDKSLSLGYSPSENDYLRLANVYLKVGDLKKLIVVYEQLIKINPKKAQYFAAAAVVYGRIGKVPEAIAAAKKAAELDPNFEKEARAFVQQLGGQW